MLQYTWTAWSEFLHFPHNEIKMLYKLTYNIKKNTNSHQFKKKD